MAYPPNLGGPPTSFKTNVNRAKTKRWVEAKSYSYDGDDWGDMDEYDEYGGYDEPAPPPRPTGLRQRGQSASQDQQKASPIQSVGYGHPQASQHGYGNLGRQLPTQQQYGARSATNPPYQQSQLQRSSSFDRGDERRAFSAAGTHQGPAPHSGMYQETPYAQDPVFTAQHGQSGEPSPHPGNYPDMQDRTFHQDPNYPQATNNPSLPHSDTIRPIRLGSRTHSMTSNSSMNDFHNRRDFSPSAVPPPLHTRDSPSPQRSFERQSAFRPPRKSSLSQHNHPEQLREHKGSMPSAESDREDTEGAPRERAGSDISKPLPFVRPADIYRRMQEEKERERQSQDSSRPSMDSIVPDDRSKNDPGNDITAASERSRVVEHRDAPRSSLDPVAERKSEYGMSSTPFNETDAEKGPMAQRTMMAEPAERAEPSGNKTSPRPQLPDVARMSGFGELFASAPRRTEDSSAPSASQPNDAPRFASDQLLEGQSDTPLQHQPSLGFRSVVQQAFDTHEPIPETPSSSTADSSIGRSGSGGTSAVSPIISRGPSSATTNQNFKNPQIRPATPPAVGDSADTVDRPLSSGSLGTPKANLRRPSPDPADQRPAKFMPGHRRDLSTPSPDNSRARTPTLEANEQLQQPQEAELATTTPIETRFPHAYGQPVKPLSGRASPTKSTSAEESTSPIKPSTEEMPKSPTESTRSRVRNLADKFESGRSSPAGSERAPSPVKTGFGPSLATSQPRPLPADRLESFRPKLPGGWESSASLAPLSVPNRIGATSSSIPLEQRSQNTGADRPSLSTASPTNAGSQVETQHSRASSPIQSQEAVPVSDPFASLAAAGSALAGAFSAAIGTENDNGNRDPSAEPPARAIQQISNEQENHDFSTPYKASKNTNLIPEASKPTALATPDDGTSSIMPTPLDKLPQPVSSVDSKAADYFAAVGNQHQQTSLDSYTTQDSASTKRSQLLPSLSTDTVPQYESDRLRREIIRELSPRLTSEPNTAESNSPIPDHSRNTNHARQQHESLVIPREYDSYWNGSSSERSSRASSVRRPSNAGRETMQGYNQNQSTVSPTQDVENPPISGEEAPRLQDGVPERPDMPPHRFSWEAPSENNTPRPPPLQSIPQPSSQGISTRDEGVDHSDAPPSMYGETLSRQTADIPDPSQTSSSCGTSSVPRDTQGSMKPQVGIHASDFKRSMDSARSNPRPASENSRYRNQLEPGTNELGPSSTDGEPQQHQGFYPSVETTGSPSKSRSTADDIPIPPAPPSVTPKIQSFREILALKEPRDRIRGYNETREQFANMDTGLAHWIAVTTSELSEHKDILPNGRIAGTLSAKPLASRTKLSGLLPSGSSTQQPYHQQYLNASSPSGASDGVLVPDGSSTQAYSPSSGSGKLSSQQMQARGKDLLHTAGLFGGKANVAAKGLFSKGKSKLRGANADKAPISSFNTNQNRSSTTTQQSSQSSPVTHRGDVSVEQPQSPKRSISSGSRSYVGPSGNQTDRRLSLENEGPPQPHSSSPASPEIGSNSEAQLPSTPTSIQPPTQDQLTDVGASQDTVDNVPMTEERTQDNMTKSQDINEDHPRGQLQLNGQTQSLHGPDPTASNTRTPTQSDYFRRGSSPTTMIPGDNVTETNQGISNGEPPIRGSEEPPSIQRDALPTLQTRYSVKTPREVSFADVDPIPNQTHPSINLENLQRASEDSEGTFHTAGSNAVADPTKAASGPHQNTRSADQEQSAEPSVSRSSSGGSSSTTPPVAVPAANIRDQPKARPFSFIQFSQNPLPKPLEDYSPRRPSIDSSSSRVDPEQDIPPSPVSLQHSMSHEQDDQSGSRSPLHHGVGYDFGPNNARPMSSSPSRSFSRPFQESRRQNDTAFRQEESPIRGDELPVQHYPAPIPRQDPIHPRQQATEYSVEGIGPSPAPQPRPRPTESRSSSKRGSRSSAFFRSFRSPTDPASPPLAGEREEQEYTDHHGDPMIRKSQSKRSSLFRSLKGGTKSNQSEETAQSQQDLAQPAQARPSEEVRPGQRDPVHSSNIQGHTPPTASNIERTDAPARMPSKHRNRLSRTAAPKEQEQPPPEPVKRNRFSAIGSLFGRSKDKRGSNNAQVDRPQKEPARGIPEEIQPPRERKSRLASLTKSARGSALPPENKSAREAPYQYTRDSLAKEGLLSQKPRQFSSRPPEPSAYSETSTKQQRMFPPRHQSLGQGLQQQEQRPSDWPRQSSLASSNIQPLTMPVPDRRYRGQNTITTQSATRLSGGLPQPDLKPRQLSSVTTTTTTTTRDGKTFTSTRQEPLGNSFARSDSPPPPPPPPKDVWRQPKSHHRSTSSISAVRNSTDSPGQTSNTQRSHVSAQLTSISNPPPKVSSNYNNQHSYSTAQSIGMASPPLPHTQQSRSPFVPNHQTLPPLQTNIFKSSSPAGPRPFTDNPDPEARKIRRSQIESSGTPRAESATIGRGSGIFDPAARESRRSQIEDMGTSKADSASAVAGVGATADPEDRKSRETQIESGDTPKVEHSHSAGAPEVAGGEKTGDISKGRKSEDEPIVMTATSFPGQEWQPNYGGWDEY
ncbi:MAG: hypothetical protein Q9172_000283 [Xanthocarpia lactea]